MRGIREDMEKREWSNVLYTGMKFSDMNNKD